MNPHIDPESCDDFLHNPSPAIQLTNLLGSAPSDHTQVLHSLYAAQIATIIWTEEAKIGLDRKSVVVGLALSRVDGQTDEITLVEKELFQDVMTMIYDLVKSK
jgi:hypothetical protein